MWMSRTIYIWFLFFAFVGSLPASASLHSDGVDIDAENLVVPIRAPKMVTPGSFATFILEVNNKYNHPLDLAVHIDKPASWKLMSLPANVHLAPGESKNVVFLMDIDRACEVGQQELNFQFTDARFNVKLEEKIITAVENIHNLVVKIIRQPRYVTSGDKFQVDFEIRNLGNCVEVFELSSYNGQYKNKKITLDPNSSIIIEVEERVSGQIEQITYINVGLLLVVEYQDKKVTNTATIKAYPEKTRRSDRYHRVPMEASLIYFGARTSTPYESSLQVEVKGRGYLDPGKRHEVDFTFRAPNRLTIARVGNFDQYSAQYTYHKDRLTETTIRVGDFAYNLTNITEMFRWARGVGIDQKIGRFQVGAFLNAPRFIEDVEYQYAVYGKYAVLKNWSVQVSGLQKVVPGSTSPVSLGSVRNEVNLGKHKFVGEIGTGVKDGVSGIGGELGASGSVGKFNYQSQYIYAEKNFPGFFTNSILANTNLGYRFNKFGVNASVFYNESNPTIDTIFTTAPYSVNYQAGFSYFPTPNFRTQLSYVYRIREDRFEIKKFSYRENGVRYRLNYTTEKGNAQLIGELLQTQNLLILSDDNIANTYVIGLNATRNLTNDLSIGGFTQYLYTNRYSEEASSLLFYGAELSYRLNEHIDLRGSFRNNYQIEEYNTDRTLLDFRTNAVFGQHQFSLITSHALVRNTVNRTDFYIRGQYTYRFGAPTKKKEGLYSLNGKITAQNPEDAAGVIINIGGQSVITDKNGQFTVNDLTEGLHYLYLESGSIKSGLIPDIDIPHELFIYAGENNKLKFNLTLGGNIKGKIIFPEAAKVNGKLPIKIVKASLGDKEFLTYTDNNGNYHFTNLLPGNWTVRIVNGDEGAYVVEENNTKLDVVGGETATHHFTMKKKEVKIKFSDKVLDLNMKKN
jgi:hypothetical protein